MSTIGRKLHPLCHTKRTPSFLASPRTSGTRRARPWIPGILRFGKVWLFSFCLRVVSCFLFSIPSTWTLFHIEWGVSNALAWLPAWERYDMFCSIERKMCVRPNPSITYPFTQRWSVWHTQALLVLNPCPSSCSLYFDLLFLLGTSSYIQLLYNSSCYAGVVGIVFLDLNADAFGWWNEARCDASRIVLSYWHRNCTSCSRLNLKSAGCA